MTNSAVLRNLGSVAFLKKVGVFGPPLMMKSARLPMQSGALLNSRGTQLRPYGMLIRPEEMFALFSRFGWQPRLYGKAVIPWRMPPLMYSYGASNGPAPRGWWWAML